MQLYIHGKDGLISNACGDFDAVTCQIRGKKSEFLLQIACCVSRSHERSFFDIDPLLSHSVVRLQSLHFLIRVKGARDLASQPGQECTSRPLTLFDE